MAVGPFFLLLGILTPVLTLSCIFVLFHSCCSHARVFGKHVHEFHISCSHPEWYLVFHQANLPSLLWPAFHLSKTNPTIRLLGQLCLVPTSLHAHFTVCLLHCMPTSLHAYYFTSSSLDFFISMFSYICLHSSDSLSHLISAIRLCKYWGNTRARVPHML